METIGFGLLYLKVFVYGSFLQYQSQLFTGKWYSITFKNKVIAMPFGDEFVEHFLSTMCRHMCLPYL
jgi:hypothetical protein